MFIQAACWELRNVTCANVLSPSPLPVASRSPAVTWLRLIPPRSTSSCSLILAALCPTSLHNLPSPNFPYRSHWLSFVCVWKAYSRLLARGCRQRAEQLPSIRHETRGGLSCQVLRCCPPTPSPPPSHPCQQTLIHLQAIDCAESIDGEANAFKCSITPHLIMMLLIAAGSANCHLSCIPSNCVLPVLAQRFLPPC